MTMCDAENRPEKLREILAGVRAELATSERVRKRALSRAMENAKSVDEYVSAFSDIAEACGSEWSGDASDVVQIVQWVAEDRAHAVQALGDIALAVGVPRDSTAWDVVHLVHDVIAERDTAAPRLKREAADLRRRLAKCRVWVRRGLIMAKGAIAESQALHDDLAAAAGELLIPIPEPGSLMSRMIIANKLMRDERDAAREVSSTAFEGSRRAMRLLACMDRNRLEFIARKLAEGTAWKLATEFYDAALNHSGNVGKGAFR